MEDYDGAEKVGPTPAALRFMVQSMNLDAAALNRALWGTADQLEKYEAMNGQLIQMVKSYEAQAEQWQDEQTKMRDMIARLQATISDMDTQNADRAVGEEGGGPAETLDEPFYNTPEEQAGLQELVDQGVDISEAEEIDEMVANIHADYDQAVDGVDQELPTRREERARERAREMATDAQAQAAHAEVIPDDDEEV